MTSLLLLVPAAYNVYLFNFFQGDGTTIPTLFRLFNTIGFACVGAMAWFCGLGLLEYLTGTIHSLVARKSTRDDWQHALYATLRPAPRLALAGAVLWTIWDVAIYQLHLDFNSVSIPIGIAAHLLAACLYLPLVYRWYKLEHQAGP